MRPVTRLRLERLENRDLLATLMWIGPAGMPLGNWSAGGNWVDIANGNHVAPINGDSVLFDPGKAVVFGGVTSTGTNGHAKLDFANLVLDKLTTTRKYSAGIELQHTLKVDDTLQHEG